VVKEFLTKGCIVRAGVDFSCGQCNVTQHSASGVVRGVCPHEKLPSPWAGLWPGFFLMYRSLCAPPKLCGPLLAKLWRRYWCETDQSGVGTIALSYSSHAVMPPLTTEWSLLLNVPQQRLPMLFSGPDNPQNSPFPCGISTPCNTWFLGPTRVIPKYYS